MLPISRRFRAPASVGLFLLCFAFAASEKEWKVPSRAVDQKNPVAADKESIAAGKKIYAAECLECHG